MTGDPPRLPSPLCVCPDPDARRCYDLRYYGHTPVERGQAYTGAYYVMRDTLTYAELDDGDCPCVCHQGRAGDLDEDGDGEDDPDGQG